MNKQQLESLAEFIRQQGFNVEKVEQNVLTCYDEKGPAGTKDATGKPQGRIKLTYFTVIHYEP